MKNIIILIGPMCAGKSTIAPLLSQKMKMPRYEMDELRWKYYRENGYDDELSKQIAQEQGMEALFAYWKPFEVDAVERVVEDYDNCVIDFGAGHSVYEDEDHFNRVYTALQKCAHVILILPTADEEVSTKILNQRLTTLLEHEVGKAEPAVLETNRYFIQHPSNYQLATMTIYTQNQTPEETCQIIISRIKETE